MPIPPAPLPPPPQGLSKDAAVAKAGLWGSSTEISRRAGILIIVLFVTGLLALSDTVHRQIVVGLALVEPVIAQHPVLGALIFMGLASLSAMLVFFSGVLLVPIGCKPGARRVVSLCYGAAGVWADSSPTPLADALNAPPCSACCRVE